MVGDQTRLGKTIPHELFDSELGERVPGARPLADEGERLRANAIHAAAGFEVRFERLGRPARLKRLNQLGRGGDFDSEAADQLDGAGIHHRDIRNGAKRRVLHGHAAHARQKLAQSGHLLRPARIGDLVARQGCNHSGFDAMLEAHRFALGRDKVIPTARRRARRRKPKDAVTERVAEVVIEEKPAVEA